LIIYLTLTLSFNWKTLPKQDDTLTATTHKYGKQTMMSPHPAIGDPKMTTTTREGFKKPTLQLKPNFRTSASCTDLLFDNKMKESQRISTTGKWYL